MGDSTRRGFLGVAGAGVVAAGAAAVAPSAFAEQDRSTVPSADAATDPVVAYVRSTESDEVSLMVGEREIVVSDRDLATRIRNAAGR